jgi:tRNA 2-thiouridine synthesizing protein A
MPAVVPTESLDTSGLVCPLPVYKAALVLRGMESGQVLELICTDPGSLADIPALARQRGDRLIETDDRGDVQVFLIEKGPDK